MVKTFFKSALQIGPWRISRKVMAFSIGFSVVVILFGIFTLHSHLFDRDWGDDWEDDWDLDDELSSGDSIMLVIMGLAGMSLLITSLACCLAQHNVPMQLPSDTPVFTLEDNAHQPVTTVPSAPMQPSWRRPRGDTRHVKAGVPEEIKQLDYPSPGYPGPPSYPDNPGGSHAPTHTPSHRSTTRRTHPMDQIHQPASMSDLPPPYAP
ncbi:unnamed protein product [Meganyctiphanes norvegica]|uniref:Uncharacterized protein n=1 Tax=Meganyctiphanes norvegica TaxID=48144 RepID=A0AAV2RRN6_MEGNR